METYKNRYWLKQKYVVDSLTGKEIANLCNVSSRTIRRVLKKWGIKKKNFSLRRDVHAKVSSSLHEGLQQYCRHKGIRLSTAIRTALIEFLIRNKFNPYK